mmetsp:Transcript_5079/g.5787  ORF Transcript_5079/g.5787 Transcript_5079/m.5787 type:complete len:281 (-) Transcript_5079:72-914(-)|eukprot:CAMPEP_0205831586 /NCGR_PEP_ID=MMETSP0206-20130828/44450_1 /ASSEMBLY_ACC=CAM_ASM_000279 /TAXON_ID=36767 /ORGANISM="Euplotes focardii, Strain TN1" /LENGTH=280 /DNA_ID=CAMNT_0053136341 /DNA_START=80 /DNA_END=922 /DNA_ORIENTATION=-
MTTRVTVSQDQPCLNGFHRILHEQFGICDNQARRGAPKTVNLRILISNAGAATSTALHTLNIGIKVFSEKSFRNEKVRYARGVFATAAVSVGPHKLLLLVSENEQKRDLTMVNKGQAEPMSAKHPLFAVAASKSYSLGVFHTGAVQLRATLTEARKHRHLTTFGLSVPALDRDATSFVPRFRPSHASHHDVLKLQCARRAQFKAMRYGPCASERRLAAQAEHRRELADRRRALPPVPLFQLVSKLEPLVPKLEPLSDSEEDFSIEPEEWAAFLGGVACGA